MTNLERKEKEVELARVSAARQDLELNILKKEDDIIRMKQQIEIQLQKESEIKQILMKGDNK